MTMHLDVIADDLGVLTYDVRTSRQARETVIRLLSVGYRNLTAELVDDCGNVIAYYDGHTWTEADRAL